MHKVLSKHLLYILYILDSVVANDSISGWGRSWQTVQERRLIWAFTVHTNLKALFFAWRDPYTVIANSGDLDQMLILQCLTWVCNVCISPLSGTLIINGLK